MLDTLKPGIVVISAPSAVRRKVSAAPPVTAEEEAQVIDRVAREWDILPVAATRTMAPLALLWFTWWEVCVFLVACSVLWVPIRIWVASLQPAMFSAFCNHVLISVPTNIVFAITYLLVGGTTEAVVSLFWYPIAAALALAYPRTRTPVLRACLRQELANRSGWAASR